MKKINYKNKQKVNHKIIFELASSVKVFIHKKTLEKYLLTLACDAL